MKRPRGGRFGRERGAVLIVALLLLVVLTLLGTSSMQNTVLQERMAGNMNQRNLALQAAEAALREGEGWLAGLAVAPQVSASPDATQVWSRGSPIANSNYFWWTQASDAWWSGGNPRQAQEYEEMPGQATPRYVIEHRYFRRDTQRRGFGPAPGRDYYRITARGVGQTETAKVTLQSHFTRRFN